MIVELTFGPKSRRRRQSSIWGEGVSMMKEFADMGSVRGDRLGRRFAGDPE
jgi:hypothetical protein